jgi:hypothetical protein
MLGAPFPSGRTESNRRPPGPRPGALPLRYTPFPPAGVEPATHPGQSRAACHLAHGGAVQCGVEPQSLGLQPSARPVELPDHAVHREGIEPSPVAHRATARPSSHRWIRPGARIAPGLVTTYTLFGCHGSRGSGRRSRTCNLLVQSQTLLPIELAPIVVGAAGVEPAPTRVRAGCSASRATRRCLRQESNLQLPG